MHALPSAPVRILFTRGLSSVAAVIAGIREDMMPGEFVVHASHRSRFGALHGVADQTWAEPAGDDEDTWLAWLAELCARERIDLVWPQFRLRALLRSSLPERAGPRWLLPTHDLALLDQIDDKAALLDHLRAAALEIALPAWVPVATRAQFLAGLGTLRAAGLEALCIKPARGIYGSGFRLLDDDMTPYRRWLNNDTLRATVSEIAVLLDLNASGRGFLLMEYLPGAERSLDCLACRGELLACVVRHKVNERWQEIEDHPPSQGLARRLCDLFGLHGVINIQTRERADGTPCLLEINLRMSGGIDQCRAGGCNLPLAALRMALDRLPADWSVAPRHGTRVGLLERGARF